MQDWLPEMEKGVFSKAMDESFCTMDYIITNFIKPGSAGAPQTVPLIATLTATSYKTSVTTGAYDAATTLPKKLEYIMTEKWINRIENPVDSYTITGEQNTLFVCSRTRRYGYKCY
jgi:hypothetical protein